MIWLWAISIEVNFKPVPYLYLNIAPAALNTTAADGALYDCSPAARSLKTRDPGG